MSTHVSVYHCIPTYIYNIIMYTYMYTYSLGCFTRSLPFSFHRARTTITRPLQTDTIHRVQVFAHKCINMHGRLLPRKRNKTTSEIWRIDFVEDKMKHNTWVSLPCYYHYHRSLLVVVI
jgi:hypothetical protein